MSATCAVRCGWKSRPPAADSGTRRPVSAGPAIRRASLVAFGQCRVHHLSHCHAIHRTRTDRLDDDPICARCQLAAVHGASRRPDCRQRRYSCDEQRAAATGGCPRAVVQTLAHDGRARRPSRCASGVVDAAGHVRYPDASRTVLSIRNPQHSPCLVLSRGGRGMVRRCDPMPGSAIVRRCLRRCRLMAEHS